MNKPKKYYDNASIEWLTRAKDDIAWTKNNLKSGFYLRENTSQLVARMNAQTNLPKDTSQLCCEVVHIQACLTAQQTAEKSLKAFLRSRGREIDRKFRTHHLIDLLRQCQQFDKDFASLEEICRILNEYYAPTRYPEILGLEFRGYEKDQAEEALRLAVKIFEFVEERL